MEYFYITRELYETTDINLIGSGLLQSAKIKATYSSPCLRLIDPEKPYFAKLYSMCREDVQEILRKALVSRLLIVGVVEKESIFAICQ